jgi:hypothetical protein
MPVLLGLVYVMVGLAMSARLLELAVMWTTGLWLTAPDEMPVKLMACAAAFRLMITLAMGFNVGNVFAVVAGTV